MNKNEDLELKVKALIDRINLRKEYFVRGTIISARCIYIYC